MSGLDPVYLLPIAAFGGVAAVVWLALDLFTKDKSRAEQRLEELRDPRLRRDRDEGLRRGDAVTRVLEKAPPALAKPLKPKTEYEAGKLKQRLSAAGFRGEAASTIFLGIKFAALMVGVFTGGGIALLTDGFSQA